MTDRLCRGVVAARGLRAVFVRVGDTARMARMLHGLYPTSAHVFAEALAAGALLASLHKKEEMRVNLQVECNGPLHGLFVDANTEGHVRGYVRGPRVHFPGEPAHAAHAALGTSGFLSVIRDHGSGQHYRSAIELAAMELVADLRRWFQASEQVATALDIAIVPKEGEPLGEVAGLLVQRLPDGDNEAVAAAQERLRSGALAAGLLRGATSQEVIRDVCGEGFELLADLELQYRCGCSQARARAAVSALGAAGVREVIATDRQAVITCEFCRSQYVVGEEELRDIAHRLDTGEAGP